jgi:HTH-like domain
VSSYYYAKKREAEPAARETRDAVLEEKIMEVRKSERKGREVYGARKVWLELNRQGIPVARCTVGRLMRGLGIGGGRLQAAPGPGLTGRFRELAAGNAEMAGALLDGGVADLTAASCSARQIAQIAWPSMMRSAATSRLQGGPPRLEHRRRPDNSAQLTSPRTVQILF